MFTEEKGFLNMQLLLLENRNCIIIINHYLLDMYERKKKEVMNKFKDIHKRLFW